MEQDKIEKTLFVSTVDKYGDKYVEHLLEQYKLYVDSVEKISDRRQKANEFFLALNSALVALLGFVVVKANDTHITNSLLIFSSLAGVTICYLWYRIILSYKGLNGGKFRVIHIIEQRLPLALYATEWRALGEGKDKSLYWPFTHIELRVPWIFIIIYLILILFSVPWDCIFLILWCV